MRRGVGRNVSVGSYDRGQPLQGRYDASLQAQAESRALIARFFIDLRQALRLTVPQAAHYLAVRPEFIEALETGQVEYLPAWSETSAIIMTYTSMADVNGRPVLNAVGTLLTHLSVPAAPAAEPHVQHRPAMQPQFYDEPHPLVHQQQWPQQALPRPVQQPQPQRSFPVRPMPQQMDVSEPDVAQSRLAASSRNLLKAGSAIANGARRLPQEAINSVRARPQRALYALSLPLGLLLILMHSSIFATISKPFSLTVQWVSSYMQEHYGPVRDGMRYIEVDDPRTRRADKLQITGGSY
jgi:hypothetical protein